MIWEDKKVTFSILRIFLALVFFMAGVFRVFNIGIAEAELASLSLPAFLVWPVIVFEIVGGICLFFNKQIKKVLVLFSVFLLGALVKGLFINGAYLAHNASELFTFNLESTDFFLHMTFFVMLVALFFNRK